MNDDVTSDKDAVPSEPRRRTARVRGPFDGRRLGALNVPLRIHDLSEGGCLIESHYEVALGRRIRIEIELPYEGWMALAAETLYVRPDYGFAVRFVDVAEDTRLRLAGIIDRLLSESPEEA